MGVLAERLSVWFDPLDGLDAGSLDEATGVRTFYG
jgi:hypothetical protein